MRYCDVSLADCACTHKSTCGACIALVGEHTCIPLAAVNHKNAFVVHLRQTHGSVFDWVFELGEFKHMKVNEFQDRFPDS